MPRMSPICPSASATSSRIMAKKDANGNDNLASITNKYAVTVFPTKILIDKNGTIIARIVGGDETNALDKKLAELFGK